jgi:carbon starvation protein CstA
MEQKSIRNRLLMALPLFVLGAILTQVDFGIIWRYFGFANQTTAVMMLWTATAYLVRHNKFHWVSTVPAMFMTAVVITFILNNSTLGFGLPLYISTVIGILAMVSITVYVLVKSKHSQFVDDEGQRLDDDGIAVDCDGVAIRRSSQVS